MFMPHLLATQAYRKVFRVKPENFNSARANTVTNALSIGYVLVASTAAGLGELTKYNIRYPTYLILVSCSLIFLLWKFSHKSLFIYLQHGITTEFLE